MKKLLYILILCLVSVFAKAQYPLLQSIGSDSAMVKSKAGLWGGKGFVNGNYTDTTQANLNRIRQYPGAQIFTTSDTSLWLRNSTATKWIRGSGSIDITSFTFDNDTTGIICFSNGVCDTFNIVNLTNVVNNIAQNFNDSSIYNFNDSTLIICTGAGAARVCDTIHLGNSNTYYFTVTGDTLITCDTVIAICVGDSCYQQQLCDTFLIPKPPSTFYQNLLWKNNGIVEAGDPLFGLQAQMNHDTYFNIGQYKLQIQGAGYSPPLSIYQYQWTSLSSSISSWQHYGAYQPTWNLLDENNQVKLYTNYTDPFVIPHAGALSGDTVGFMGNRYGYMLMTNSKGYTYGYQIDDMNAKQTGIMLHTYGSDLDAVTIFGNQVPATYPLSNNNAPDTTLLDARIAVFKTNGQVQFPQYTTGAFPLTFPTHVLVTDADGNIYQYPPSGTGGGGLLLSANNGVSVFEDTTVQLFGSLATPSTLLNDRYLNQGAFKLFHSGNLADYLIDVQNANASGSGIYALAENTAIAGQTTNGIGVNAVTNGGYGLFATSANGGTAIYGQSTNGTTVGLAGFFEVNDNTNNNVAPIIQLRRNNSGGTPAAGIGASIEYYIRTSTGSSQLSNQVISKWSTATHATRTSQMVFTGVNSTTTQNLMTLAGSGQLTLDQYTTSNFNGGAAADSVLVVTSTGVVKKRNSSSFGTTYTFTNGLTESPAGTVKLGGTLIEDTHINTTASYSLNVDGTNSSNLTGTLYVTNTGLGTSVYAASYTGSSSSVLPPIRAEIANSTTNDVKTALEISNSSGGTSSTDGIGVAMTFKNTTSTTGINGSTISNSIQSKWTIATHATRTSQFIITGVNSATTVDLMKLNGDGSWQITPITATAASAITPAEGMLVFVSNTNGTFVSVGIWCYQNGAWKAL